MKNQQDRDTKEGRRREVLFAQCLAEIRKLAKEQGGSVSREQIEEKFAELALTPQQYDMICQYLNQYKIGVGEQIDPEEYLEQEEKDYLETYLAELRELPMLSEGEKEAVTLSAMAGDMDAQRKLTEVFLPDVVEIAKLYAGQGVYLEDLIGEGNLAVASGVSMLGALEHAAEAQGMIGRLIMDAMEEYIGENADESRKDQKIAEKVNKVADAAAALAQELRRKVTVEELMQESGMSRKSIEDAIRMSGSKIEDLEPAQS